MIGKRVVYGNSQQSYLQVAVLKEEDWEVLIIHVE